MKKIEIFVGSDSAFEKIVPKSARNLSEMAAKLDDGNKKMDVFVNIPGQPEPKPKKKKKLRVQDFVIHADEYCSVQEHVIINFTNFIFQMSITNMYIQNPPKNIREQIYRTFDKSIIHETQQPYLEVSKEMIQTFNSQYSERVIGQERAKKKLLQAIYPLVDGKQSKPVVILLYGDSGLGKTESAQYMAELMGGKLLRKQFSMYQNNESANYIFGGRYNEKSFAQDLLARETNVLLFDEFDKAWGNIEQQQKMIQLNQRYKEVNNTCMFYCIALYFTLKDNYGTIGEKNTFDYFSFYRDNRNSSYKDEIIDYFANKFLQATVKIMSKLLAASGSGSATNWLKKAQSQTDFFDTLSEEMAGDLTYQEMYTDFVKRFTI